MGGDGSGRREAAIPKARRDAIKLELRGPENEVTPTLFVQRAMEITEIDRLDIMRYAAGQWSHLEITTHAERRVTVEVLTAEQLWERWLAREGK